MARVLFLCISANDNPASGGRTRIISESKLLTKHGYNVRILAYVQASKYRNPRRLYKAKKLLASDAGAPVNYFPQLPTFKQPILIWLNKQWMRLGLVFYRAIYNPKVVHCHGHGALRILNPNKQNSRKFKILADVHGLSAEEAFYATNEKKEESWLETRVQEEVLMMNAVDYNLFVSNNMYRYYEHRGYANPQYSVIPCLTYLKPDNSRVSAAEVRNRLGNGATGKLIFVYSGSYRKYQKAQETINLFKEISIHVPNAFLLILTGHVSEFKKCISGAMLPEHSYTILTLGQDEVHRYLLEADVSFLLRDDTPLNNAASPTKFAEYALAGLPCIISKSVGDFSQVVAEKNIGVVVEDFKLDEKLMSFLIYYRENKVSLKQKIAAFAKQELTWEGVEGEYIKAYQSLID